MWTKNGCQAELFILFYSRSPKPAAIHPQLPSFRSIQGYRVSYWFNLRCCPTNTNVLRLDGEWIWRRFPFRGFSWCGGVEDMPWHGPEWFIWILDNARNSHFSPSRTHTNRNWDTDSWALSVITTHIVQGICTGCMLTRSMTHRGIFVQNPRINKTNKMHRNFLGGRSKLRMWFRYN